MLKKRNLVFTYACLVSIQASLQASIAAPQLPASKSNQTPKSTQSQSKDQKPTDDLNSEKPWTKLLKDSIRALLAGNIEQATKYLNESETAAQKAQDTKTQLACLNLSCFIQAESGQIAPQNEITNKALQLATDKFGKQSPQYAQALALRSSYLAQKGEVGESRNLFENAQAILQNDTKKYPLEMADTYLALARRQKAESTFGLADDSYGKALSLQESARKENDPLVLLCCKEYSTLLDQLERKQDSQKLKDRINLANATASPGPQNTAGSAPTKSGLKGNFAKFVKDAQDAEKSGDKNKAQSIWKMALHDLETSSGSDAKQAFVLVHLADLLAQNSDGEDALSLYKKALSLREKAGKDKTIGAARNLTRIANRMLFQKNYSESESLLRKALQIEESVQADKRMIAATLQSLVSIYMVNRNNSAAADTAQKLLTVANSLQGASASMYKRTAIATLGSAYMQSGRLQEGMKLMQEIASLPSPGSGKEITEIYTKEYAQVDAIVDEDELKE